VSATLLLAAVLVLRLLAGAFRQAVLDGLDGPLDVDEARLALAADGALQTGLPTMPTGRLYPRGLLNTYLIAGSSALLGRHDFAVRLPSVVAGTLLVPMMFLLGRLLGGTAAGLAAGSFVAVAR
jgi:4-amino-4-deoxy-L-arabinose transferase-like glycosyltransferase